MKRAAIALMALTLAGCAGGPPPLANAPPVPSELTMPGRWMLAAPNAPACGLNFTGRPGANEGNVAPEGGCPERFFTSRRWTVAQNTLTLTVTDDDKNVLAQFSFVGERFEGKSGAGVPLTLER